MSTYGERLAGVSFNPSGDPDVDRMKRLCADLMDFCDQQRCKSGSMEQSLLYEHAMIQLLLAQMLVVKAITWRDE